MTDSSDIRERFEERFGTPATVLVRAPGRVNLIGEHTDYSGLPVMPIAIDRTTTIAVAPTGDAMVRAVSATFEEAAEIHRSVGRMPYVAWHRYVAGALKELAEIAPGRGANILIESDLPAQGGLSSSSALTVGLVAALSQAWESPMNAEEAARTATRAERLVGVETGGMDQQVAVLGRAGHALRIDFLPPATRYVPLSGDLAFVVAYSGEEAPKGTSARDAYNERVVGTRIAALMLANMLGTEISGTPLLGHVADIDAASVMVDELPEQMSPRSAANSVEASVDRIVQLSASHFDAVRKVPVRRLAQHVLAEAERVDLAETALNARDYAALGRLLNESHDSLRNDFKCSTPALDKVAAAMRKSGAYGARLTGAGFGGFALAVCAPDMVDRVIAAAETATRGPSFEVHASDGLSVL